MQINKNIYINSSIGSTRIAILENDNLSDIFVELPDHKKMVGNIFKGKVQNVLPDLVIENELDLPTTDPDLKTSIETKFLSVKYTEIIPLLVKAIQEQQAQIDMLYRALDLKD